MWEFFKVFLTIAVCAFFVFIGGFSSAQDQPDSVSSDLSPTLIEEIAENTAEVQAQDLDAVEPTLLPSSKFYFLKEWQRKIKVAFTFGAEKKAVLQSKIANARLLELRKMAALGLSAEKIEKATQKYEEALEKVKEKIEVIKEKASENPKIAKFLEQVVKQQDLHQKILKKLEQKVPTSTLEKIKEVRENHLERFQQIKEKLQEKIGNEKLIGGDKDMHGCLIAAGYSWCPEKQKCLRVWEEPCATTTTDSEGPNPVPRGPLNRLKNKLQNLITK